MAPRDISQTDCEASIRRGKIGRSSGLRQFVESLSTAGESSLSYLAAHPGIVQMVIWTVVLGSMAVGGWMWANGYMDVKQAGYPATFYLNLIGSASIVLPVPGLVVVCVAATESLGLHLGLLGLIGGTGAALGETTAYLAGFAGHGMVEKVKWYPKIHVMMEKRGGITIFLLALVPNPLIDIAGIAAGALRYPYLKFIAYIFVGKTLRFVIMAYACRESIGWLEGLLKSQFPGLW